MKETSSLLLLNVICIRMQRPEPENKKLVTVLQIGVTLRLLRGLITPLSI